MSQSDNKPSQFKDHFSQGSQGYAEFRPVYPLELAENIAKIAPSQQLALDCGCGTGQLSVLLAKYFDKVVATDASNAQIEQAKSANTADNIEYKTALAEDNGLPKHSVDLITVAQAAHWLDLDKFYQEVRRVGKPNAILALITYGVLHVAGDVDTPIQTFYYDTIGGFWPPERQHVENGYQSLTFPFHEMNLEPLAMTTEWNLDELMGYLKTWSAVRQAEKMLGYNPVDKLKDEIAEKWGNPTDKKRIEWPLTVRVGKVG